ncbi:hypothetical protein C9994_04200 [Marivirga lumbricoides]|uniref:DUF2490 domain-containing protein n=1 Tax=Marivirga lumbricoides TaxID=1046115 RepID=A0A2T4DTN3_9BACT|nr:hypothetical protein C9994_04200 [Marivirga lumbricoides]
MTTYSIKEFLVFISLFLLLQPLKAQNIPSVRWEPGFSFTKKMDDRWSYNLSILGRQRFTNYGEGEENFRTDRWEIKAFGTYTLFGKRKLSLGYMYRKVDPFDEDAGYEHRLTQQFAFLTELKGLRLANKIRVQERIRSSSYFTRLRYSISSDFPLNGESLDEGELYFIAGNEVIYEFNSVEDELENRFSIGLGKLFQKGQKLQLAVESQYSDLISEATSHILQVKTVYYFSW